MTLIDLLTKGFCSGPVKISRKAWLARENNPTVLAICKSTGGVPASQITWYSDDEVIQNQVQSISDLNQSTLKLNLTREQDGAFVTCRAPIVTDLIKRRPTKLPGNDRERSALISRRNQSRDHKLGESPVSYRTK